MWSVGVTWLELMLATPHVFAISERQRILLEQALHLDKQPQVGALPTVHRLSSTEHGKLGDTDQQQSWRKTAVTLHLRVEVCLSPLASHQLTSFIFWCASGQPGFTSAAKSQHCLR